MAKNKITDLRDHLFEIIELLKDDEQTHMTIEKAKAISDVAQVIINTAKLETDYIRATDGIRRTNYETKFLTQNLLDDESKS
jgi:hypothetical protein|tara:strand:- start:193 stop:438 length:246 start_codon:yes stop_codon:yes gene_type:complete